MRFPVEVFISYAHPDRRLLDRLFKHLNVSMREGLISCWHDHNIRPGQEFANLIDEHLNSARIIILGISPDFMASDYCYQIEMKRALERHEAGEAVVIPVILRPVDWQASPLAKLAALPNDGKPVTEWANRDTALLQVAKRIRMVAEHIRTVLEEEEVRLADCLGSAEELRHKIGRIAAFSSETCIPTGKEEVRLADCLGSAEELRRHGMLRRVAFSWEEATILSDGVADMVFGEKIRRVGDEIYMRTSLVIKWALRTLLPGSEGQSWTLVPGFTKA